MYHEEYQNLTDKLMRIRTVGFGLYIALFIASFMYALVTGDEVAFGGGMLRFVLTAVAIIAVIDLACFIMSRISMGRGFYYTVALDTHFWLFFAVFLLYVYIFRMYQKGSAIAIAFIALYVLYRGLVNPKRYFYMSVYQEEAKEVTKLRKPQPRPEKKEEKKTKKDSSLLLAQEHLLATKKTLNDVTDEELRDDLRQLLNRADAITTHFIISEDENDAKLITSYGPFMLKYAEYLSQYSFAYNRKQDVERAMDGVKEVMRRIQSDIYKSVVNPETVEFINNDAKLRKLKE